MLLFASLFGPLALAAPVELWSYTRFPDNDYVAGDGGWETG